MTTTFKNIWLGAGVALIALVSLALPTTFVQADYGDDIGVWDIGETFYPDTEEYFYPDTEEYFYPDTQEYFYPDTEEYYYPDTEEYYYDEEYYEDYGYGGFQGGGYSMPSFGGGSYGGYSYGGSSYQPYFPSYTPPSSNYTNVEYCKNNSCNTYTDNTVNVVNSYNNQKKQQYNDCYHSGYNQGYGYGDGYDQAYGYGQQGYNYGSYQYDGHCYNYSVPTAYNTTPYISLSSTPYTGLDLGPFGEVLYWTFLVLWCLGAAYLIVVKRVQNKLVSFLNGFLFGTASTSVATRTHAPAQTTHVAASAPLVEEGIDPFIASQIKR